PSRRSPVPPRSAAKPGGARPAAQANAQTIGAAAAVAAKASERSQLPKLKLSLGTVSIVQPNWIAGRNDSAAILGHSDKARRFLRPAANAAPNVRAVSKMPASARSGQCG